MSDTFRFAQGPAPEVAAYLDARTVAASFDWRDIYGQEHAFNFTVAKATQLDVLTELHTATRAAIDQGLPFEAFKKQLAPKLRSMGWWGKQEMDDPQTGERKLVQLGSNRRLKTIYWANTRTAYGAGKWQRAQRTKKALPYFVYRLGVASEHRPHHVAKENVVLPVDHPFWDTWYPPNGWGCNCWLRQITKREAERYGGESTPPQVPMREWTNKRTGEVLQVPEGIDAGWQTNPGKSRAHNLAQHLSGKLDAAPAPLRKAAMHDMLNSQAFKQVQGGAFGTSKEVFVPVAIVPENVAKQMGATTRVALFSPEDAAKQIRKRDGLDGLNLQPNDYLKVQQLLDNGVILHERERSFSASGMIEGKAWFAAFRVTKNGTELFLKSFRRANPDEIALRIKKGRAVGSGQ
ncbi:phage minor head protein [Polycladidibacter hongkongensis]|uniref:phage head morphogenesis protein n=1 Tax=Polycladidibacter hongkongensis TaxID=1647556 RepID=UPI0008314315|nr:phage minor head protein [Pseudovibrio hongkongensis]